MNTDREKIEELILSGISADELYRGIEVEEPGIVGLTKSVAVKTTQEKRDMLFVKTHRLIEQNRDPKRPLTDRNILQEIGGGPLKEGEWIQISASPNKKELIITGTRGVLKLDRHTP